MKTLLWLLKWNWHRCDGHYIDDRGWFWWPERTRAAYREVWCHDTTGEVRYRDVPECDDEGSAIGDTLLLLVTAVLGMALMWLWWVITP